MSFAHRVLKVAHRLAQNMLPADQYIWLARRAIPLMDPRRRNSGVTIERANDLFCARRSGSAFYFDSHFKLGRYLFREESASIGAWLLTKYSFGKVRIKPGDIVVEVGANVGEFTCAAAAIAARVLAIDPDPRPYRCLTLNVAGLPNVSAYNLALGDFDGHSTLYVASARSDSSLIEPTARWTSRIHIDVCTLATLMSRAKIERIDFLKLEAEGFEPEILLGAVPVLRQVDRIAIDASPERRGESTVGACLEILHANGFTTATRDWMVFAWRD